MEWVETTGRSIDEAKDAALDQLGVDESEAEFDVLEEPRTGLFGRIRGEARIRARIKPTRPRPKVERRDRGRRRAKGDDAAATDEAGTPAKARSRGGAKRTGKKAAPAKKAAADAPAKSAKAKAEGDDAGAPAPAAKPAKKAKKAAAKKPAAAKAAASDDDVNDSADRSAVATEGSTTMTDDDVTVAEQADLTAEFLGGLLDAFGVQGSIEQHEIDEETIEVTVDGEDLGLLIGPKGATLLAVQDLSRTYVQRKATGHHEGRIRIDVGGYRQRRREALERFAQQVAAEVKESGVQKALEPMVASDRKVVHDAVNAIDGVRTISEGEDLRRRVVIIPE